MKFYAEIHFFFVNFWLGQIHALKKRFGNTSEILIVDIHVGTQMKQSIPALFNCASPIPMERYRLVVHKTSSPIFTAEVYSVCMHVCNQRTFERDSFSSTYLHGDDVLAYLAGVTSRLQVASRGWGGHRLYGMDPVLPGGR